jgi:hypothetical protein
MDLYAIPGGWIKNRKAGFHDQPSPKFMTSIFHDRRPEARWQLKNET